MRAFARLYSLGGSQILSVMLLSHSWVTFLKRCQISGKQGLGTALCYATCLLPPHTLSRHPPCGLMPTHGPSITRDQMRSRRNRLRAHLRHAAPRSLPPRSRPQSLPPHLPPRPLPPPPRHPGSQHLPPRPPPPQLPRPPLRRQPLQVPPLLALRSHHLQLAWTQDCRESFGRHARRGTVVQRGRSYSARCGSEGGSC